MAILTLDKSLTECIEHCSSCHEACLQLVGYCLSKGGDHAAPAHIRLLRDCAEICQVSANFMLRESPLHVKTCAACAEICQACADECGRFADDQTMQKCAEHCRRCAESCRRMAA